MLNMRVFCIKQGRYLRSFELLGWRKSALKLPSFGIFRGILKVGSKLSADQCNFSWTGVILQSSNGGEGSRNSFCEGLQVQGRM